jgi:hypothetical protein
MKHLVAVVFHPENCGIHIGAGLVKFCVPMLRKFKLFFTAFATFFENS